ncbi:MAG: hypothetical protein HPY83_12490 [Anaerolineae bacterium]|nr:hypothetical protein [Anaerolineae bacterium]
MADSTSDRRVVDLQLLGGQLCLDFANTVDWRLSEAPIEWLKTYGDLIAWGQHAGALEPEQAQELLRHAERRPEEAAAALQRALRLRESIYRVFAAVAHEGTPPAQDLETVNAFLGEAMAQARIVFVGGGYVWGWSDQPPLDRVLWPVVRSAADLLTQGDLGRVRQCAGDPCGWLFLDRSRNRSRRWCAMSDCGNRAKARRFYRRRRAESK